MRYLNKTLIIAVLFAMLSTKANAQLNTYGFSSTANNLYTRITNPSMLPVSGNDTVLRLPFTFYLDTARTDTLWLSQHGFAAFKKTGTPGNGHDPLTTNLNYKWMIAPFGVGFNRVGGGSPSTLKIDTTGTSPNRIFIAEWSNFRVNGATGTHTTNFQMWLYETSNKIEFRYGTFTNPTSYEYIQVGLRGLQPDFGIGDIAMRRATTNNWVSTIAATNLNGTIIPFNSTHKPDSGLVFVWTVPPPCNTISNIGTLPDTVYTCFNTKTTIERTTAPVVSGLWYQWQKSTDKVIWNDVTTGTGFNNAAYTTDTIKAPIWYRLKATCMPNSQVYYTNACRVKNSPALNTPYHEDFEGALGFNQLPECMYSSLGDAWVCQNSANGAYSGTIYARYYDMNSPNDALITQGINMNSGVTYRLSFWYNGSNTDFTDTISAMIGTFPHKDSLHILYPTAYVVPGSNNYGYKMAYFNFTVPAGGIYYVGINARTKNSFTSNSIDDIDIRPVPATDVFVDSVYSPSVFVPECYTSATDIKLRISNIGTTPVSNIPVYYKINGTQYGPETVAGPIAPGSNLIYTFTQKANMSGNYLPYTLSGRVALPGDNNTLNDTTFPYVFYTDTTVAVPYLQNFDGLGSSGVYQMKWKENAVNYNAHTRVYNFGGRNHNSDFLTFETPNMPVGLNPLWTPQIGPVTLKTFLEFDYRIVNYQGTTKMKLPAGDTVFVVVSNDCGVSYDTLMTIHAGNQADTTKFTNSYPKSLAAYAGSKVRLAFWYKRGTVVSPPYFDVDNFNVRDINPKDIALTALYDVSTIGCIGTAMPVKVALKNLGGLPAGNFNIKADFGSQVGIINYTYTGTLEHMKEDTLVIGSFTPNNPGTYAFRVYAVLSGDTSNKNDSIATQVYIPVIPAAPVLTGDTFCGAKSVQISAIENDSMSTVWYTVASGGTPVFRGAPYTTPVLYNPVTYYAEQVSTQKGRVGKAAYTSTGGGFSNSQWGLLLDVASDSRLDSFAVYPTGTGYIIVKIVSCTSCVNQVTYDSIRYNFTNATGTKTMLAAGTFLPKGNGYFMRLDSYNGISLSRDFPFTDYPYRGTAPIVISSGYGNGQKQYDGYYYFYDMAITAFGCGNGTRTPVNIKVDPLPLASFSFSVNAGAVTITNNSQNGGTYAWTFGDGGTSTAFSPTHIYTQNGSYAITLVQTNDCGSDTTTLTAYITGLSLTGINKEGKFKVYPNPAKDELHILLNTALAENIRATIYNAAGQMIKEELLVSKAGEPEMVMDIHGLPAGNYVLRLANGKEAETVKFSVATD